MTINDTQTHIDRFSLIYNFQLISYTIIIYINKFILYQKIKKKIIKIIHIFILIYLFIYNQKR